jgi:hypothetical protein
LPRPLVEPELQPEGALPDVIAVQFAAYVLERESLAQVVLLRVPGDEHALLPQHIARDAVIKPLFAADALPLEVAGEVGVAVGIRVLQINRQRVMEGQARLHRNAQYRLPISSIIKIMTSFT